jgi:hypothetical protein
MSRTSSCPRCRDLSAFVLLLTAFCVKTAEVRASTIYTTVSFANSANATLQAFPEPTAFNYTGGIDLPTSATGNKVFGGVPFFIPTAGNGQGFNGWNAQIAGGNNPRVLTITTNIADAVSVDTLIDTYFGIAGPTSDAYVEFLGAKGSYYRKDLVGGVDIRNYTNDPTWTNTINGTTTVDVLNYNGFGPGQNLDMQTIGLPTAFRTDTLTTIRLVDNGIDITKSLYDSGDRSFQRIVLSGVTVASVPEPSSMILVLLAVVVIGLGTWMRSRRAAVNVIPT